MLFFFLPLALALLVDARACYGPNVAHPLPDYSTKDAALKSGLELIEREIDAVLKDSKFEDTSFSVAITSSKETLWEKHHTAAVRNSSRAGVAEVDGDTVFRIASITKVFTVLGILYQHKAGNLSLDASIDTYISELREEQDGTLPWKDITIRSLASQLSGIPREFAESDIINRPAFYCPPSVSCEPEDLGLPPAESIERDNLPKCDEYGENFEPPCTKDDLLRALKSAAPVFAPNQKSTYSNVAFELLGLALSRVTGLSYEDYMEEAIFKPLKMSKSSLYKPDDSAGIIPHEPQYWDVDEGIQAPTGGIYTSSADMSKYLRYVLTHYNGITPALNWINPASPGEGINSFYGIPWEIFRTDKILLDSRRTVQFITKGGGIPGYFSIVVLLPEYDLGITILIAGKLDMLRTLQNIIAVNIVRAAEAAAIKQLQERYAGTYVSQDPSQNSSLALVADHRGLVVEKFISNGTDVFRTNLKNMIGVPKDQDWYMQIFPTMLYKDEAAGEGEKWRLVATRVRDDQDRGIFDEFCPTDVDYVAYGARAINEFVFSKNDDGVCGSVSATGFRAKLVRQEEDGFELGGSEQEFMEL